MIISDSRFTIYELRFTISPMDTEKAYNLALDYLYSFVDYSLKHASELAKADFNLDRMRALMDELGNPEAQYPIIHVAGTKGKGSVSALCASALGAAGYKTGLYTSPHLQDYAERIQVNGHPIPHADLSALVEEIKPAVARVPYLTTFEITTALGFLYFARQNCDAAVIEVGLGGRLDATNIVTPRVSVITSLSLDHTLVLGDTLDKIAGEKAGIIKAGVPVVSAPQKDEALAVLKKVADEHNSDFTLIGRDIEFTTLSRSIDRQTLQLSPFNLPPLNLTIPLLGEHQVQNAAVAYAALKASGLKVSDQVIQKGFQSAKWRGRFEIARKEPPIIFESAHNQDSFARMAATLETYFPERQVYLIMGASEDKNLADMFAEMKPKIKKLIATRADHPRALEPEVICQVAEQVGVESEAVEPVEAAFHRALDYAQKDGSIVLSAGSMFVTAEVMTAWDKLQEL
ncbi:MAG: folylpolyglutamate synthase/dihydrofolate synthase family protein [Anaerolineales bacterium]